MERRIVCAALRNLRGDIVCGARHFDGVMRNLIVKDGEFLPEWDGPCESGFIDQRGNFLNRIEAWKIAEEQGQIIRRCGGDDTNGGTLYSENLY